MGKHRRELLGKVANLYKQEKQEFYQKYRLFQLHKWEILRSVKESMLEHKIKQIQRQKQMRRWLVLMMLRHYIQRTFERFDRERFIIMHRKKMIPIFMRIRTKLRKRVLLYGDNYVDRERKYVKDSTICIFGGCARTILRERAKSTMLSFIRKMALRTFVLARFKHFNQ